MIRVILILCLALFSFKTKALNEVYQDNSLLNRKKRILKVKMKIKEEEAFNKESFNLISLYDEISYLYSKKKNYLLAIENAKKMATLSSLHEDTKFLSKSYKKLANYFEDISNVSEQYRYLKLSLKEYLNVGDSIEIAKIYRDLGQVETRVGDFELGRQSYVKALQYITNKDKKESIYFLWGVNYKNASLYKDAIKKYELAINSSENIINKAKYYNAKANAYRYIGEYDKAIKIFMSLLDSVNYEKKLESKARVIDNLSYTMWLKDSSKNVLPLMLKAKLIREQENDWDGLVASYAHLSDVYNKKDRKESLKYAQKMLEIVTRQNKSFDIIEALDKVSRLKPVKEGIKLAHRSNQIRDSLFKAERETANRYALIKYESKENEKKAIKNKLIAEKQKSQKQGWIFAGISILLGAIVFIIYWITKTKKEKVVEVYKTETRLAKRIHDELANDVYVAMHKVQQPDYAKEALLEDLENIYAQTRDISHENSPVLTGDQFEEFLKQLLANFTTDKRKVINKGLTAVEVNTLAKEKQIVLYRVLQELLVNMDKYSKATLVMLTFLVEKNKLKVTYKDNGEGAENVKDKNGLQNVETRIKSINGTINFKSEKGKGFQVDFQFSK